MKVRLIAENGKIGNDEWAYLNAPDRQAYQVLATRF
jgi:hypothetical protein